MAGTLGVVGSVVGIGSGLNSIFGGGGSSGGGGGTQAGGTIYDPFGLSNRQAAGGRLMQMMGLSGPSTTTSTTSPTQSTSGYFASPFGGPANLWQGMFAGVPAPGTGPQASTGALPASSTGSSFMTSDPSYQFRYQQGLDALQRGMAASGMGASGNTLAALMNYGQQSASQEFGNEFSRLAAMAGVGSWSGSNYGALQAGQQQQGWNAVAQGLGGLAKTDWSGLGNIFGSSTSSDYTYQPMGGSTFDMGSMGPLGG